MERAKREELRWWEEGEIKKRKLREGRREKWGKREVRLRNKWKLIEERKSSRSEKKGERKREKSGTWWKKDSEWEIKVKLSETWERERERGRSENEK